jgi:hypothetical protein
MARRGYPSEFRRRGVALGRDSFAKCPEVAWIVTIIVTVVMPQTLLLGGRPKCGGPLRPPAANLSPG